MDLAVLLAALPFVLGALGLIFRFGYRRVSSNLKKYTHIENLVSALYIKLGRDLSERVEDVVRNKIRANEFLSSDVINESLKAVLEEMAEVYSRELSDSLAIANFPPISEEERNRIKALIVSAHLSRTPDSLEEEIVAVLEDNSNARLIGLVMTLVGAVLLPGLGGAIVAVIGNAIFAMTGQADLKDRLETYLGSVENFFELYRQSVLLTKYQVIALLAKHRLSYVIKITERIRLDASPA
ncbi:hypothetical protein ACFELO_14345 [Oceanicaulis sp. LC35]|uniref:hypothetical protein n=1 Tax=Oceanicaulis sp. LC35 TaxID=3349635 RepID=UPI003F86A3A0